MTTAHAKLQPSSAARWLACPGSVKIEALCPQDDSEASAEGTLAHAVAAAMLGHGTIPAGNVTEEMQDGAEMLYDDVVRVCKGLNSHVKPVIEGRVDCSEIHPDCWGTPDVRVTDVALNVMHIWDYKFGHRHVEAFENKQMICYAIGAMKNYGTATTRDLMIHLHIVQPRSYHKDGPIRTWSATWGDIEDWLGVLQEAAIEAVGQHPATFATSECLDCKARHACPTLQSAAYAAAEYAGKSVPFDLGPAALGRELMVMTEAAEVLKARITGLEAEVIAKIKGGKAIGGWTLTRGSGREKWDRPIDEVLALGEMMGIAVSKPDVITPKQAIKAGIPAVVVASYSVTPRGEVKLTREDARKVFS